MCSGCLQNTLLYDFKILFILFHWLSSQAQILWTVWEYEWLHHNSFGLQSTLISPVHKIGIRSQLWHIPGLQERTSSSSRPRIEDKLGLGSEEERGSDDSKDEDTTMDNTVVSQATATAQAMAVRNVAETLNSLTQEVRGHSGCYDNSVVFKATSQAMFGRNEAETLNSLTHEVGGQNGCHDNSVVPKATT